MTNKFWEDFVANSRPLSNGALRLPVHQISPAEINEICSKFEGKTDVDLRDEISALIKQHEECFERTKFYPIQPELIEYLNYQIREIRICLETRWIERMAKEQQHSENPPCA